MFHQGHGKTSWIKAQTCVVEGVHYLLYFDICLNSPLTPSDGVFLLTSAYCGYICMTRQLLQSKTKMHPHLVVFIYATHVSHPFILHTKSSKKVPSLIKEEDEVRLKLRNAHYNLQQLIYLESLHFVYQKLKTQPNSIVLARVSTKLLVGQI